MTALAPDVAPRLADVIGHIDNSSSKMNQMLNDLLDFGRLQAGQPLSLQRRSFNLVALARDVAKEYARNSTLHRIVVSTDGEALVGKWDSTRLEQLLSNLLSNALKYSPAGGMVTIKLWREQGPASENGTVPPGWAMLSVQDEGIGIAPSELTHGKHSPPWRDGPILRSRPLFAPKLDSNHTPGRAVLERVRQQVR